jgi:broad specificity phosphatase PhoE
MIPLFSLPFWFLRHGETEANAADLIAGATDSPLTAQGRAQAKAAAERLTAWPLTAIYSSPLSRARDTADAVARKLGLPVTVIDGLAERRWGAWEGQPRSILVRDAIPPGGGEGPDVFRARVLQALATIPASGLPLVVAHSGIARVLREQLLGADVATPLENGRPVRFQPQGKIWRMDLGGPL